MAIFFFDLNTGGAAATPMTVSADNGLSAQVVGANTNIQLGDTPLSRVTELLLNGHHLTISDPSTGIATDFGPLGTSIEMVVPGSGTAQIAVVTGDVGIVTQDDSADNKSSVDVQVAQLQLDSIAVGSLNTQVRLHPDELTLTARDDAGTTNATIDMGAGIMQLTATDPTAATGQIQVDIGDVVVLARNAAADTKQVNLSQGSGDGIVITDAIDSIGLQGDVLFPVNGNPNQYVQAGNTAVTSAINDTANLSASAPANVSFLVGASDAMLLLSTYTLFRTGLGNVAITVTYTDPLGNAITTTIGITCNAAAPNTSNPAVLIKAKSATTINLNWVLTGAMSYDAGGVIQLLGS